MAKLHRKCLAKAYLGKNRLKDNLMYDQIASSAAASTVNLKRWITIWQSEQSDGVAKATRQTVGTDEPHTETLQTSQRTD